MPTRGVFGAALGCAALAWLLLALGDPAAAPRERARLRQERTAAHLAILRGVSARLAGLEALPPELLARTLAEVSSVYPEWSRLLVCDSSGRVLAAMPARDTALIGALDPSDARRAALARPGASPSGAYEHLRPGGGVELGIAATGRYVTGDLPDAVLEVRLEAPPTSARVIASWALATIALLFTMAAAMISSRRP